MSKSKPQKQPLLQQLMTADRWVRKGFAGQHYRYTTIEPCHEDGLVDLVVSVVFAPVGFNPGWCSAAEADCSLMLRDMLKTLHRTRGTTRAACVSGVHTESTVDGHTALTFRIRVRPGR